MENLKLLSHFGAVKVIKEHNGYIHSVGRTLAIVILGSLCGLDTVSKIHQWAESPKVLKFLKDHFAIHSIPTCRWLEELLSIIDPKSLNQRFTSLATTLLPKSIKDLTV